MSYIHDPNATLVYGQDWTDWLATGETITAVTASCTAATKRDGTQESPAAITISAAAAHSPLATWQAAGGTDGVDYDITVHVTSSTGEQDDRTTRLKCRQR